MKNGRAQITSLKTPTETTTFCKEFLSSEPFKTLLLPTSSGSFYIYFAECTRRETEATGFLTKRGGEYQSQTSSRIVSNKASRPILTKTDGSVIKPFELWNAGWRTTLVVEERYSIPIYIVTNDFSETGLTLLLLNVPFKNSHFTYRWVVDYIETIGIYFYCNIFYELCISGGAKVKPQDSHMRFGVYLCYNLSGYGNFVLNV